VREVDSRSSWSLDTDTVIRHRSKVSKRGDVVVRVRMMRRGPSIYSLFEGRRIDTKQVFLSKQSSRKRRTRSLAKRQPTRFRVETRKRGERATRFQTQSR
jgi:hypothetical protein